MSIIYPTVSSLHCHYAWWMPMIFSWSHFRYFRWWGKILVAYLSKNGWWMDVFVHSTMEFHQVSPISRVKSWVKSYETRRPGEPCHQLGHWLRLACTLRAGLGVQRSHRRLVHAESFGYGFQPQLGDDGDVQTIKCGDNGPSNQNGALSVSNVGRMVDHGVQSIKNPCWCVISSAYKHHLQGFDHQKQMRWYNWQLMIGWWIRGGYPTTLGLSQQLPRWNRLPAVET